MFSKIKKTTSSINIMKQIQEAIAEGKLKPGDKLPSERELAELFQISRPVVREAISALSFLGIIQRKWGKGNYISEDLNISIIKNSLKYIVISKEKEIRDLLEARKAIECELISLAALRRTERHLKKLEEKLLELLDCDKQSPRRFQLDYEFHLIIGEAANNDILHGFQFALKDKILGIMKVGVYLPDAIEKSNKEHLEMFKAIKSSDPETAKRIMEIHIKQLEERHIKRLETIKKEDEKD